MSWSVKVRNVSKTFKIPHERHATLKASAVNILSPKKFTVFDALKDVDFEIAKGEFFGIIGRNGSGKSTLLKIIAGIYRPTSGTVDIDGRISPFLELGVGFNPELTARENVFLNGAILGLTRNEIAEKFDDIIAFSELEQFVDQKLKRFSSGMQVRLAFSVAVQAHAEIILVDEVLAVGDARFQEKCFGVFRTLKKEGRTIVFVSHGMPAVQEFSDRVLLLEGGKIVDIGPPKRVVLKYSELNLEDEQHALKREVTNRRWGTGDVEVLDVEFLDGQGAKKSMFGVGEPFTCRVTFQAKSEIAKPIFGVSIHRKDGAYVYGMNTKNAGFGVERIGTDPQTTETIDFSIDSLRILPSDFLVTVGIFNEHGNVAFDFIERGFQFRVAGDPKDEGMVKLDSKWTLGKG